jgi:hypothetical protein
VFSSTAFALVESIQAFHWLRGRDPGVGVKLPIAAKFVDVTDAREFEPIERKNRYLHGAAIHNVDNLH